MNNDQQTYLEYGQRLLKLRRESDDLSDRIGGAYDRQFGHRVVEEGLHVDPVTGKKVDRPTRLACMWAAEDIDRFKSYIARYPNVKKVRGLYDRFSQEERGEDLDPCVYIYRMKSPLSGQIFEPQMCKIGYAKAGAAARVASQSKKAAVGYIPNIEIMIKCGNPERLEKLLHTAFEDKHIKVAGREWFNVLPDDIEAALEQFESDGILWRKGGWVHFGRRAKKKRKDWSSEKTAAYVLYKKILPRWYPLASDDPSSINMIAEDCGLGEDAVRAGLAWLIEHKYLDRWDGGQLTPSEKFQKEWYRKQAELTPDEI